MTHERSSTSSSDADVPGDIKPRTFPAAALVALITVCVFEAGLVLPNKHLFQEPHDTLLEVKKQYTSTRTKSDFAAIFGSSRFYHLDPQGFEEALGNAGTVTNYSWAWSGLEAYEAMLRTQIQSGNKPRVLLVEGIAEVFGYPIKQLTIRLDEGAFSRYNKAFSLIGAVQTEVNLGLWSEVWKTLESKMLPPSLRYRAGITGSFLELLRTGNFYSGQTRYEEIVIHWKKTGWLLFSAPNRVPPDEEYEAFEQLTGPHQLYIHSDMLRTYEHFLKLAEKHNIQVILLPVPSNPLIYKRFMDTGVFARYDEWLDDLESRYPNFKAPAPRWLNWPDSMGDPGHVNRHGANLHTAKLLEMVTETISSKTLDLQYIP